MTTDAAQDPGARLPEPDLGQIVDALPDGVVVVSKGGHVLACNASASRLMGLEPTGLVGRQTLEPAWPVVRADGTPFPPQERPSATAFRTGERVDDVLMGVHRPDGVVAWIRVSAQPLYRPGEDQPHAVVATFVDISRHVRAHRDDLEAADAERLAREAVARAQEHQIAFQAQLLRSVQTALVAIDLEGRVLYWNAMAETLFGYSAEEAVGASVLGLVIPRDTSPLAQDILAGVLRGRTWSGEFVCCRKDGSTFTVLNATSPIVDAAGRVIGAVGGSLDASELVASEREARLLNTRLRLRVWQQTAALRAGHARFRAMSEATPLGMVLVDEEGRRVYANAAYQALREKLQDDPLRSAGVLAVAALGALSGEDVREAVGASGERTFLSVRAVSMHDRGGHAGHLVLAEDVTARRHADQALRESEERYRTLFVDSGDAIVLVSSEGLLVEMNPAATVLLGLGEDSLPAPALDLLGPAATAALQAKLREGRVRDFEVEVRRRDGRVLQCLVTASARRTEQGDVAGYQAIVRDVTERRAADTAVRELSGRILRIQDEERRRIARDLHDSTAQVLTALSLNLALLRGPAGMDEPRARAVLEESHALAAQCAQEIRTASYLLHPPLLDEAGLPAALRWYCDGVQARSGLRVTMQISPALDRLPEEMETAVFRIVQESLNNIHRHSGSATARIILSRGRRRLAITVRDTGRGIPEDRLAILNDVPASVGLGIAGMRERVGELGGRMVVLSSPRGTTVRARIPLPPALCRTR